MSEEGGLLWPEPSPSGTTPRWPAAPLWEAFAPQDPGCQHEWQRHGHEAGVQELETLMDFNAANYCPLRKGWNKVACTFGIYFTDTRGG